MQKASTIAFALFATFLVAIVLIANNGHGHRVYGVFSKIPHYDKIGHFLLMGGLSFLAVIALAPRIPWDGWKSSLAVMVGVSLIVTVEELSQSQVASRTFSLPDLGFSLAGILFCGALGHWLVHRNARRVTTADPA